MCVLMLSNGLPKEKRSMVVRVIVHVKSKMAATRNQNKIVHEPRGVNVHVQDTS